MLNVSNQHRGLAFILQAEKLSDEAFQIFGLGLFKH
jgi:hypothetical protein